MIGMTNRENSNHASWIDVVRFATSSKDGHLSGQSCAVPYALHAFWMSEVDDENDRSGCILKRLNRPSNADIIQAHMEEEAKLVSDLMSKLERTATFTSEVFFGSLKNFLEIRAKDKSDTILSKEDSFNDIQKKAINVISEEHCAVLFMLRESALILGQQLVATILECCVTLSLWDFVRSLLEKRVVSANRSRLFIDKLIENKQVWLLCLSIKYISDLQPGDFLQIIRFFLGNLQNVEGSFDSVRQNWKKETLSAIMHAQKHRNSSENNENMDVGALQKFHSTSKKKSSRHLLEALKLAAAFDGFLPAELCLHGLIALGQDDVVLSTVISELDAAEALQLLQYLNKWIGKYLRQLEHPSSVKSKEIYQVPTLSQVAQWASLLLDVHYTTIVLSSSFRDQLKATAEMVRSLIKISRIFSSLIGLTEHLASKAPLPEEKPGYVGADHIIEFMQIS